MRSRGYDVTAIMFDYGQENFDPTAKSAVHYCAKYNAQLEMIKLPYDWSKASIIRGNYVDEGMTSENIYKKDVKKISWVPARNATMLLIAGGIASERGISEVYCSFQFDRGEWKVYDALREKHKFGAPDLTPAFIKKINEIGKFCYKTEVKFIAEFIEKKYDCNQIVKLGRKLKINYSHTYSCRYYVNGKPCGKCEQCVIRKSRLKTK